MIPKQLFRAFMTFLLSVMVVLISNGCGSSNSDSGAVIFPGSGPTNAATPSFAPGQRLFGRFFVVPVMLFSNADVISAVNSERSQLVAQGHGVSPKGDVLAWPASAGSNWLIRVADQTVLVGPDGSFSVNAPEAGAAATGTVTNPTNPSSSTTFSLNILTTSAEDATILFAAMPFGNTSAMGGDGNTTATLTQGDLLSFAAALPLGPAVAPAAILKETHESKAGAPPSSCCSPGSLGPSQIKALASGPQPSMAKALASLAKVLGIPIMSAPVSGILPVTGGALPGTYPPADASIIQTCPQNNGDPNNLLNARLGQNNYLGSTCDHYVLDGTCQNEQNLSDTEYLAFLQQKLGSGNAAAIEAGLLNAVFLYVRPGTLGPSDRLTIELPPVLVQHPELDAGHVHCINNHRGRVCGQFLKGDLSVKEAETGLVATTGVGQDIPQLGSIVGGANAPRSLKLVVPPGHKGSLVVHNNGTYGVTMIDWVENGQALVTLSGTNLPVAGAPSLQTLSPTQLRLLHFDRDPNFSVVNVTDTNGTTTQQGLSNSPSNNRRLKEFTFIPDQTIEYKIDANATPGQQSTMNLSVDDQSIPITFLVGSVRLAPIDPVLGLNESQNFQASLVPSSAGDGSNLTYHWNVSGSLGGTLSDGGTHSGQTDFDSTSPNVVYKAPLTALADATDVVTVTVYVLSPNGPNDQVSKQRWGSTHTTVGVNASDWDAARDFTLGSNPNGAWSYGSSFGLGSGLVPYAFPGAGEGGLSVWAANAGAIPPEVVKNDTGASYYSTQNHILWQAGDLSQHPGSNGQFAIVRWTALKDGQYQLHSQFTLNDQEAKTTDVHVLKNGASLFDAICSGYGGTQMYDTDIVLTQGDTIDFVVGYGVEGNYLDDTTLTVAHIKLLP